MTIIGSQIVVFAVSARTFAVNTLGEKPDRLLAWGNRHLRLERGLAAGFTVLLVGLAVAGYIVAVWIGRGFGQLSEEKTIIFASALIILGAVIFSAFFLSILASPPRAGNGFSHSPPAPPRH